MKNFITAGYNMIEFDSETQTVKEVCQNVSTMIDYTFIAPADGVVVNNGDAIPVKAGDVILKLYGEYDEEADTRKPGKHVILDSNNEFAKHIIAEHNRSVERRKSRKQAEDCCAPQISC